MNQTPYYIIDEQKLKNNLYSLETSFKSLWNNFTIGYSFKTNNLPWILNWVRMNGAKAEVVSFSEFELAKAVGFPVSDIIYNGPCKGYAGIEEAIVNGAIVNLDNFEEVNFLVSELSERVEHIAVGLRINFDLESYCPGETISGNEPGRFGFNVENGDFRKAVQLLHQCDNIRIVGLHGHHSTKTKSLKVFHTIAEQMCSLVSYLDEVEYLDLGGCLFGDKPGAPSFDEYASTIVDVLEEYHISKDVNLIMEPGAALIASPVSYVCHVIGIKDIKNTRLVFTDGSKKHIAPQMNEIKFASSVSSKSPNHMERQVITGFSCIENDRFLELCNSSELNVGDTIEIFNTGAYSLCLAPLFIEFFPQVFVKTNEGMMKVREAWSVGEFMQKNYF